MTPPSFSLLPGLDAVAVAGVPQAMPASVGFGAALAGTLSGPTPTIQGSLSATARGVTTSLPFPTAPSGGVPMVLAQTTLAAGSPAPAARLIATIYGIATTPPAMMTIGTPMVPAPPSPAPDGSETNALASNVTPLPALVAKPGLAAPAVVPVPPGRSWQQAMPAAATLADPQAEPPEHASEHADNVDASLPAKPEAPLSVISMPTPAPATLPPADLLPAPHQPSQVADQIAPSTTSPTVIRGTDEAVSTRDKSIVSDLAPSTPASGSTPTTVILPLPAVATHTISSPGAAAAAAVSAASAAPSNSGSATVGRSAAASRKLGSASTDAIPLASVTTPAVQADELQTAAESAAQVKPATAHRADDRDTPPADAPASAQLVPGTAPNGAMSPVQVSHKASVQMPAPQPADVASPPDGDRPHAAPAAGRTAPRSIATSPDTGAQAPAGRTGSDDADAAALFMPTSGPDTIDRTGTPIAGKPADPASVSQTPLAPALAPPPSPTHAQGIPTAAAAQPLAPATAPTPATATVTVTPAPGQMGHDMGVAIARHVRTDGGEAMTVRLDPREMGRIEVRMHFDDEGVLRAVVSADNPASLDLLRRDSADLNRALGDAGVRADQQSLRFDTRAGTGGGTGGGGNNGTADGQPRQHQTTSPYHSDDVDADGGADIDPVWRPLTPRGRIDLMA